VKNILKKILNFGKDEHFNELIKGSAFSFVARIIGMLSVYAYLFVIANKYGAYELGIFSLALTILNILSIIPKFGFDNALMKVVSELRTLKRKEELPSLISKSFTLTLSIALLLGLLLTFGSDLIATKVFSKSEMAEPFKLVAIMLPFFCLLGLIASYFRGLKNMIKYILYNSALISILFLLFLLLSIFMDINTPILRLYLYSILVTILIAFFSMYKELKPLKKKVSNLAPIYTFKKLKSISIPLLFASSFSMMMSWSDIIMLGILRNENEVGIYSATFKLATLTSIVLFAVNAIVAPKFAEFHAKKDIDSLKKIVRQSSKLIFFTSVPILIVLWVFPRTILGLYGDEFVSGATVLIILAFGQLVNSLCGSVGYLMQMIGQEKMYLRVLLIALLINLILNVLLIPIYGIIGAAIASAISLVFWNIYLVVYVKKTKGISTLVSFNK